MRKLKRTTIHIVTYLGTVIFLLTSCSESFFEKQASDKITPDQHYQTFTDVKNAYDGVYSLLQDVSTGLVVINGLMSDMMETTGTASLDMIALYNHNIKPGNSFADPSGYYKIIINANEILSRIDSVTTKDKDFNEYELFVYKGYLIAMRSWAYFNIARLYGEVVYIDDNIETFSSNREFNKYSRNVIIDTLINQVKKYARDKEEFSDTRKLNCNALLAEMYIDINQYDSAFFYANQAISLYGSDYYKVDELFYEINWKNIFVGASNNVTEVISAVPFSKDDNQFNKLDDYFNYSYNIKPTKIITDLFEAQFNFSGIKTGDVSRGKGISYDSTDNGTMISKYSLEQGNPFSSDITLIRAAELHLIMAEALNRIGDVNAAMIILNRGFKNTDRDKPKGYSGWTTRNIGIRGRANLSQITEPIGDPTFVMMALEDSIIQERALELAFEGKRWFDLERIARRRSDPSYLANKVAAKYSNAATANEIKKRLLDQSNWYLPKDY